jgi:broad specificity phosphatase PhoE
MSNSSWILVLTASGLTVGITLGVMLLHKNKKKKKKQCTSCGKKSHYPKRIILIRHGESEGNIDPLLYCHVPDNAMHLTELGYEQAIAAGKSIKKIISNESIRFIVSPYIRTIETFEGISRAWGEKKRHSLPWSEEPRIREQDFGNFQEPMKIRECKIQRRKFGAFFYRFPSGESPADVYDRVSSFLESLHRMFYKNTEENYVIVTHGVAIRVILTRYFKYRISEFEQLENFHNGEFVVLENDGKGTFHLRSIVTNKVHLDTTTGEVNSVDTFYSTKLRVRPYGEIASNLRGPFPMSPNNHFRRSNSSVLTNDTSSTTNTTTTTTKSEANEENFPIVIDTSLHPTQH